MAELEAGEYTETFRPEGVFYKDATITVVLEEEINDNWKAKKDRLTIQKDTFHSIYLTLAETPIENILSYLEWAKNHIEEWMSVQDDKTRYCGINSDILGAYCPSYTSQPPQRRMDMFEFDPTSFV